MHGILPRLLALNAVGFVGDHTAVLVMSGRCDRRRDMDEADLGPGESQTHFLLFQHHHPFYRTDTTSSDHQLRLLAGLLAGGCAGELAGDEMGVGRAGLVLGAGCVETSSRWSCPRI
jgi:hypothetical protein